MLFFEENQINELIICPYCKNKYDDPRIVNCGASFCHQCIELLIKDDKNSFLCPVCQVVHVKQLDEYFKNTNLAKLCDKQANEVSRGSLANTLSSGLGKLKQKLDKLSIESKLGADRIKEHCDGVRNEVQLCSEELIQSISEHNLELIEQIDAYEKAAMLNYKKDSRAGFDEFLSSAYTVHAQWTDYLKQFKISDDELNVGTVEVKQFVDEVEKEINSSLDKLFGGDVMMFERNSAFTKSIGALISTNVMLSYKRRLDGLKKCNLADILGDADFEKSVAIKFLKNGAICVVYTKQYHRSTLFATVFDRNLNFLYHKQINTDVKKLDFKIAQFDDSIVMCLPKSDDSYRNARGFGHNHFNDEEFYGQQESGSGGFSRIVKICNAHEINEAKLNYEVGSVDSCGNYLYCLPAYKIQLRNKVRLISTEVSAYGENLNFIEKVRLIIPSDAKCSFTHMLVSELYFMLFDLAKGSEIVLMSKENGTMYSKFSLASSNFVLEKSLNYVFAFESRLNELVCYNCDGKPERLKLNNQDTLNKLELVDCLDKGLLFLDSSSLNFYF